MQNGNIIGESTSGWLVNIIAATLWDNVVPMKPEPGVVA
jgi:hypothetical protein